MYNKWPKVPPQEAFKKKSKAHSKLVEIRYFQKTRNHLNENK